jgi:DNA-directed RNA polymerase subunit RPC12/RpoP
MHSTWSLLIAGYMLLNCWGGLKGARAMIRIERLPRREGFACPNCGAKPPAGALWRCAECKQAFDTFQSMGVCPHCGSQFPNTMCTECQQMHPLGEWMARSSVRACVAAGDSSA